jgi:HNH endonuclease
MDRFLEKVRKTDSCWLWTASLGTHGYGQIYFEGKPRHAYRVAYELFIGPVPGDLELDHLCRVRACVNPSHLEPVTHRENIMRSPVCFMAENAKKTQCIRGHEYSTENTYRKPDGRRECRLCRVMHMEKYRRSHAMVAA